MYNVHRACQDWLEQERRRIRTRCAGQRLTKTEPGTHYCRRRARNVLDTTVGVSDNLISSLDFLIYLFYILKLIQLLTKIVHSKHNFLLKTRITPMLCYVFISSQWCVRACQY